MRAGSISVIVVNYNRRSRLDRALTSIRRQSVSSQSIVIDNGSTEPLTLNPTDALIADVLIENDRNVGFARAVNQGIARASGEFIALLNNDAVADPLWLEQMLRCMNAPDVGMVAAKILVASNPSVIDKAGHLIYPDGQNRGRGSGEIDRGQYDREEEVLWPDGCAALYRRSMLEEIGGFDETFFAYGEDAELGLRARIAGWRCIYAPRAVVLHERAATLGLGSARRVSLIERNRVLLAAKHFPLRLLLLNPFYYAARLAAGAVAAARGRGEAGLFSSPHRRETRAPKVPRNLPASRSRVEGVRCAGEFLESPHRSETRAPKVPRNLPASRSRVEGVRCAGEFLKSRIRAEAAARMPGLYTRRLCWICGLVSKKEYYPSDWPRGLRARELRCIIQPRDNEGRAIHEH